MMIIKRYIAKEFSTYFLVCALSLLVIAIVFSTLAELPTLEEENGVALFTQAILSGVPLLIEVIVPISVLLATVLAFISLSRTSEIIAMMAAGVSLFHLVLPVIWCGAVISGLLYLNQSYLAPYWGADERAGLVSAPKNMDIWRYQDNTLYFFESPDKTNQTVAVGRSFHFDKQHTIDTAGILSGLNQVGDTWRIESRNRYRITEQNVSQTLKNEFNIPAEQFPVVFTKDHYNPKYTGFIELINEIRIKIKGAVNYNLDLFALYQKIAGLLSIFVMILLALPFSIYSGRSANVRTGIVISVVLGFVFWLVDQILLSFNNTGMMPTVISAFGANVMFFSLAVILIRRKKS